MINTSIWVLLPFSHSDIPVVTTEWLNYITASLVIKIMRDKMPEHIHSKLSETIYSTRWKPQVRKFYDNARGKIGKQSIQNWLQHMDRLTENWLHSDWNNEQIRTTLKKTFFQYAKWKWIYINFNRTDFFVHTVNFLLFDKFKIKLFSYKIECS